MNDYDNPILYDIAKQVTLDAGMPYTDPRTGITTQPTKKAQRQNVKFPRFETLRKQQAAKTVVLKFTQKEAATLAALCYAVSVCTNLTTNGKRLAGPLALELENAGYNTRDGAAVVKRMMKGRR